MEGSESAELVDADLGDGVVAEYFGAAYPALAQFAELLAAQGEMRGLIGPRELPRIWSRHIVNCGAVAEFLPDRGVIGDVGSGAGLPGIVVAAMKPDAQVLLIEPMERRCAWLKECSATLGLGNIEVRRARAQELVGTLTCDAVTARAVAALPKLASLCLPLVRVGGELVALKGQQAQAEAEAARGALRKLGAGPAQVMTVATIAGLEPARVVRVLRLRT